MVEHGGSRIGWSGVSASIARLFLPTHFPRGLVPHLVVFFACIFLAYQGSSPVFARIIADSFPSTPRPDGTVLLVNNTTGDVYISLTSKDNVRAGTPFNCFDPRTFGTGDAVGLNGSIEVLAVTDTFTRCRITRTSSNRAIQPGDVISNIVYHNGKNLPTHFVLFGDFDLDGDGIATAAERDRMVALIRAHGGVVDDTFTATTNYLVLGRRPGSPSVQIPPSENVPGAIVVQRTIDQKRYDELQDRAVQYAIPVLNTNRFLSLVGYYGQGTARP